MCARGNVEYSPNVLILRWTREVYHYTPSFFFSRFQIDSFQCRTDYYKEKGIKERSGIIILATNFYNIDSARQKSTYGTCDNGSYARISGHALARVTTDRYKAVLTLGHAQGGTQGNVGRNRAIEGRGACVPEAHACRV